MEKTLRKNEDKNISLRPNKLSDFIGQEELKRKFNIAIYAAKKESRPLDHILLFGPPGLGKTTLAESLASEMNTKLIQATGSSLKKVKDLVQVIAEIKENDILFIDEIHRIPKVVEEVLYSVMEDFVLDIVVSKEFTSSVVHLKIPKFTLIGATTRFGDLSFPFRDRFSMIEEFSYYKIDDLVKIVNRSFSLYGYKIDNDSSILIATRSRGTPRIVNRFVRRIKDYALFYKKEVIDTDIILEALNDLGVDKIGLEKQDRRYLRTLIEVFNNGPCGLASISHSMNCEIGTVEDVIEPYLLSIGLIKITKSGRCSTSKLIDLYNSGELI